jgi:acyl dehydratase
VVSQAKIAEFAAALGDADNPAYQGPDAVAPATFAVVIAAKAWDELFADLGLELARTIHVEQRFEYARPLRVGDEIRATLAIDKLRARAGTALITFTVRLADAAGEEVCAAVSTLMHQDAVPA